MGGDYYGDDGYDYRYRRGWRPAQNPQEFLNPAQPSLYRSRSQGHGVAPTINVYNRMYQEQEPQHQQQQIPVPVPVAYPAYPAPSPEFRGRSHLGNELVDDLAEMALERRYRSRSRGRSDAVANPAFAEWELAQKEAQLKDLERQKDWEREADRIRTEAKIKAMQEDMKKERDDEEAKNRERRIVEDYERRQREGREKAAEEERRLKEKLEREQKEQREKKDREWHEFLEKQKADKEKAEKEEKEAYERFLKKQQEKKEKEEKEKKESEEKFQNEMRRRLANLGYTEKTIEIMIDEEKAKKFKADVEKKSDQMEVWRPHKAPIYPKVHRDYLAIETLKYYDLPWEYDRVSFSSSLRSKGTYLSLIWILR